MSATSFNTPAEISGPEAPQSDTPQVPEGQTQETPQSQEQQQQELILGKFQSQEDLIKAYQELESKLGQRGGQQSSEAQEAPSKEEFTADLKEKGVELDGFYSEFYDNDGKLTEESYKKLEEAGYPREVVDRYMEGQRALMEKEVMEIFDSVGGKENYEAAKSWAMQNLSKEELQAFDRICDTGDKDALKLAVSGLYARYLASEGKEPNLTHGQVPAGDLAGFASIYEMKEAMRDPRYGMDPEYMKMVENKLRNTTAF